MTRNQLSDYLEVLLEDEDLETILERYDMTPLEALLKLHDIGLINEAYGDTWEAEYEND